MDCAMAGAATAEPARPTPAAFRNSRRFMAFPLILSSVRRLEENYYVAFPPLSAADAAIVGRGAGKKKGPEAAPRGLLHILLSNDHPRRRARIWKVSKVYSATCHHRYSSPRN